ncbi:MAG: ABC transporter ATP-binding protein [Microbacteriaceae bacterium]
MPLLSIRDLHVEFALDARTVTAVERLDVDVDRDEVVALVGESGSGKSVSSMSVLGLLPSNARVSGSIRFEGTELVDADAATLRSVRGGGAAMVFQDPSQALDPVFTVGHQLVEAIRAHQRMPRAAARERALELLRSVEMPDPEQRMGFYPHQLSGGQAQRVVIAIGLAGDPRLLIADEPTTALDVTVQAEVLDVIRRLRERRGMAVLVITHDMGVVADIADRVIVMRDGAVVETGATEELFAAPVSDYTRALLAAVPRIGDRLHTDARSADPTVGPVVAVRDLVVEFSGHRRGSVRAVDGVSFDIRAGEVFGVVGESGSGKTTVARSLVGLSPVTSGSVTVAGTDVATARGAERLAMRRRVGVVFQNPLASLNPRYTIAEAVGEPLRVHRGVRGADLDARVDELLASVGLGGGRWRSRYPHELSGGQRQRVAIARAVSLDPFLLVADEPTSALDVSVQRQVLDVIRDLQDRLGFACLFVSHDLAVVDEVCDRVAVMRHGRIVEMDDCRTVLTAPNHEYTRALIAAAPVPDPAVQRARRAS